MDSDYLDKLTDFSCSLYEWLLRSTEGIPWASVPSYEKLKNFQYRIGVVGGQSVGKSTLLNTLLGFPYLPTANVATTNCVTSISFGADLELAVISYDGTQVYTIALENMPKALFAGLRCFAAEYLIKVYGLNSLDGFTDAYSLDENGILVMDDSMLHMHYDNIRHRAALVLHLLQTYVDQNSLHDESLSIVKAVNQERDMLLNCLEIPPTLADYEVHLKVNSPLLRDGLVLVDLPGSGAIVNAGIGRRSQNELMGEGMKSCDAMMVVLDPCMTLDIVENLDVVLNSLGSSGKQLEEIGTALIPILNKMDMPGATGCQSKIDAVFAQRNLDFSYNNGLIRISAAKAERRLYDGNPEMSVLRSSSGQTYLSLISSDEDADYATSEEFVWHMLEKAYKSSGFDHLLDFLSGYISRAKKAACLRLLDELDSSCVTFLNDRIQLLKLMEAQLNNNRSFVEDFLGMIQDRVEVGMLIPHRAFSDAYLREMSLFIKDAVDARYPEMEKAYFSRIASIFSGTKEHPMLNVLFDTAVGRFLSKDAFQKVTDGFTDIYQKAELESINAWEKLESDTHCTYNCLYQDLVCFIEESQSPMKYSETLSVVIRDACKELIGCNNLLQRELRTAIQSHSASEKEFVCKSMQRAEEAHDAGMDRIVSWCTQINLLYGVYRIFPGSVAEQAISQRIVREFETSWLPRLREIMENTRCDFIKECERTVNLRIVRLLRVSGDVVQSAARLREAVLSQFAEERLRLETEIQQLREMLSRLDSLTLPERIPSLAEAEKIWMKLNAVCVKAADALDTTQKE